MNGGQEVLGQGLGLRIAQAPGFAGGKTDDSSLGQGEGLAAVKAAQSCVPWRLVIREEALNLGVDLRLILAPVGQGLVTSFFNGGPDVAGMLCPGHGLRTAWPFVWSVHCFVVLMDVGYDVE